ncbi:hypothetical protein [Chitinophaga sp. ARDCPP14]|uniref:hypothetical protein n=1 Tax=Chitinophaga sp. ARDCPP14 TaxID=3391139 RepID=UPI003F52168C
MEIDIKNFNTINVVDCCSVWNILSSSLLFAASQEAKCFFSITKYVEYECLTKTRKTQKNEDEILQNKLKEQLKKSSIQTFSLSISDLQEVELLRERKKLGLGELSSIAFAKRTKQAIITDDQKARKLSKEVLGLNNTQTTPHLFGWLLYYQHLSDSDLPLIIKEHNLYGGPLELLFNEVYLHCLHIRLMFKDQGV